MAKLRIKKGDTVQVIAGPAKSKGGYRGETGKVIAVYPTTQRVLVEGINRIKKHTKVGTSGRGSRTGGIVTQEAPIHISNVAAGGPGDEEADPGRRARRDRRAGRAHQARPDPLRPAFG